jgi:DNA-binding transcriptional LysR family regulator
MEDGSFSAAARNLDLTPSAVSKVIARIESRLGMPLFRRGHREIALTPEGETYCQAARAAVDAVDAADAAVFSGTVTQETLRVRSMPIFAQKALVPVLPRFRASHPKLRLEIHLRIDPGNLLDDGMDVAVHVGHLEDSRQVAMRFSRTRWIICAAPECIWLHTERPLIGKNS